MKKKMYLQRGSSLLILVFMSAVSLTAFSQDNLLPGDVNRDGAINIGDALVTVQHSVGLKPPGFFPEEADVDGNGDINIVDALYIAQYYVGLISEFPGWPEPSIPPLQEGMTGYAVANGGTTGGEGGPTVTVTNASEFEEIMSSKDPYIVHVRGTTTPPVYIRGNKTIIGMGGIASIIRIS